MAEPLSNGEPREWRERIEESEHHIETLIHRVDTLASRLWALESGSSGHADREGTQAEGSGFTFVCCEWCKDPGRCACETGCQFSAPAEPSPSVQAEQEDAVEGAEAGSPASDGGQSRVTPPPTADRDALTRLDGSQRAPASVPEPVSWGVEVHDWPGCPGWALHMATADKSEAEDAVEDFDHARFESRVVPLYAGAPSDAVTALLSEALRALQHAAHHNAVDQKRNAEIVERGLALLASAPLQRAQNVEGADDGRCLARYPTGWKCSLTAGHSGGHVAENRFTWIHGAPDDDVPASDPAHLPSEDDELSWVSMWNAGKRLDPKSVLGDPAHLPVSPEPQNVDSPDGMWFRYEGDDAPAPFDVTEDQLGTRVKLTDMGFIGYEGRTIVVSRYRCRRLAPGEYFPRASKQMVDKWLAWKEGQNPRTPPDSPTPGSEQNERMASACEQAAVEGMNIPQDVRGALMDAAKALRAHVSPEGQQDALVLIAENLEYLAPREAEWVVRSAMLDAAAALRAAAPREETPIEPDLLAAINAYRDAGGSHQRLITTLRTAAPVSQEKKDGQAREEAPLVSAGDYWDALDGDGEVSASRKTMNIDGIPRRARMDYWIPAERAIYDAVQVVESMIADERLTRAVILLGEARSLVADFVDGVPAAPPVDAGQHRNKHSSDEASEDAGQDESRELSFAMLRDANRRRLPQFKNKHGQPAHSQPDGSDWSPAQWLQAATGELGEYANIRKKFERGDLTAEEFQREAADELADVVTYLDILAFQLRIDLGHAVASKFNRISERVGADVRLPVRALSPSGAATPTETKP